MRAHPKRNIRVYAINLIFFDFLIVVNGIERRSDYTRHYYIVSLILSLVYCVYYNKRPAVCEYITFTFTRIVLLHIGKS